MDKEWGVKSGVLLARVLHPLPKSESGQGHVCPLSPGQGPDMTGAMTRVLVFAFPTYVSFTVRHLPICCVCVCGRYFQLSLYVVSVHCVCVQFGVGVLCYCVVAQYFSFVYRMCVCVVCLCCVQWFALLASVYTLSSSL